MGWERRNVTVQALKSSCPEFQTHLLAISSWEHDLQFEPQYLPPAEQVQDLPGWSFSGKLPEVTSKNDSVFT